MSVLDLTNPASTVVVVGASLAGLRACEALRADGFAGRIVVVERERNPFYDRPPLSKQFLAGTWDETRVALRTVEKLEALQLELEFGLEAIALDPGARTIELADHRTLAYDGLVLATGAAPRRLPSSIGGELAGVGTLRTLDDAHVLRSRLEGGGVRLVVVGGGFLGMEVAASARALGAAVTVVEPLETPLARVLGPGLGGVLARIHSSHGVNLRLGVGVSSLEPDGDGQVARVVLDDGSALDAHVVLVAIGAAPVTAWLEGSGLAISDGIVCDEHLAARAGVPGAPWSSEGLAPGVVAAGDLVRWPHPLAGGEVRIEHWTNAAEQGAHAARTLLAPPGAREPFREVPYFWSDHYDLKVQALGLPSASDDVELVDGTLDDGRFVACFGREGALTGVVGFGRPRQLMAYRPLLARGARFAEALAL